MFEMNGREMPVNEWPLVCTLQTAEPTHKRVKVKIGYDPNLRTISVSAIPVRNDHST